MSYPQAVNTDVGSSSSDNHATKRARTRGSTACNACRARRSKCDLIDRRGCHRCKQLGTACSLEKKHAGEPDVTGPAPTEVTYDTNDFSAILSRLATLEKEVQNLRNHATLSNSSPANHFDFSLNGPNTQTPSASAPTIEPIPTVRSSDEGRPVPGGEERDETWYRRWADPESFGLVHRGMKSKGELGLRDPLAEGIITKDQAESAYQLFKYHCTAVFPHPHLMQVRSSIPAQPFYVSACLYYITHCPNLLPLFTAAQVANLKAYLIQNLDAYHRGCRPSLEGIMAAFVLSLLPPGSGLDTNDVDASRMIGLAYAQVREMGQSVFLDRLLALLESGTPVRHLEQQLNDARLFMSVINRSAWFAHSRCPWASLPVLVEGAQPKILAFLQLHHMECDLDRHLMYEQECLSILFKHSRAWQDLQRVISPSVVDVIKGNEIVKECTNDLDALLRTVKAIDNIRSKEYLLCHITYCQWWVSARNVWSIYRLPSPLLGDQTHTSWLQAMTLAAQLSIRMLNNCLEESWRLAHWPAAIGRAVMLCYVALSTGIIHFQHLHPKSPLPDTLNIASLLSSIHANLSRCDTELGRMISGTEERLAEYKSQLENSRLQSMGLAQSHSGDKSNGTSTNVFGDTNVDLADFFSLWSGEHGNADAGDTFGGSMDWWTWPMGPPGGEETNWGS